MKKIAMLLFVALATISCSKDDSSAPAAPAATNSMKIYNKTTGAEIKDGDVVVFTSNASPSNKLSFYVKNTSSSAMNVRSRLVSVLNTDGNSMQYCFGQNCFYSVAAGQTYPSNNQEIVTVPANAILGDAESFHMESIATPTSGNVVDYVFEFYQHDSQMNEQGNKVRFTYRYQQ